MHPTLWRVVAVALILAPLAHAAPLAGAPPAVLLEPLGAPVRCLADKHGAPCILALPLVAGEATSEWLRPGAMMSRSHCTFGFVFEHVGTGALAIITAGHCVLPDAVVRQHLLPTAAPGVGDSRIIGKVAFQVDEGPGSDLALIEIDEALVAEVRASMWGVGGPCGAIAPPEVPALAWQVGHPWIGEYYAPYVPVRAMRAPLVAADAPEWATLGIPPMEGTFALRGHRASGDSGGPVRLQSGEAVGIHTHGLRYDVDDDALVRAYLPYGVGTSMPRIQQLIGPNWRLADDVACT